jgi:hypothetical protein
MKRLGALAFSLCAVLTALYGVAVVRGRSLPPTSDEAAQFGLNVCDGKPCFFGLIPGQASYTDARNAISQQRDTSGGERCTSVNWKGDPQKEVVVCPSVLDETKFGPVVLGNHWDNPTGLTLAAIVLRYGAPCNIFSEIWQNKPADPSVIKRRLTLNYPALIVQVFVVGERVEMASSVVNITLFDSQILPASRQYCNPSNMPLGYTLSSWRGFTRLRHYASVP